MIANAEVMQTQLANGLGIVLREDHSAPIASVWTWYRVGSRNEQPGTTGVSHWVEHMQFKGTPSLAKGQVFRDVSRVGGTLNALTSHDWTAYFETLPAAEIGLAFRIESDRMVNSLFASDEVESERTVILSERQGAENNPGYVLYEETLGAAFRAHPYRHMVIGYEHDLRRITRTDLYDHYRRFYHPADAFIVAVGDFSAPELLTRIEESFGGIAAGEPSQRAIAAAEPPQIGTRRVVIERPSGAPYLRIAFHAPGGDHPDLPALLIADTVLSGGKPMGFGGGGGMGRSSRLYRSLVAAGLARGAGSDMGITVDPYLFQVGVTALPAGNLEQIEGVVATELARLRDEPVPADELARAIRQFEAQFIYSSEGVTNQAYWLGQWEIVDSWQRALSLAEECRAVTAADIQRVAATWLDPARETVGWLVPTAASGGGDVPAPEATMTFGDLWGISGAQTASHGQARPFQRETLANGIPVLGQERSESQSVAFRVRIKAGTIQETPDESGLAHLTARSLLRGSAGRSYETISARTDELGSSLSIDAGREFIDLRVRCLRDDLPEMIALAAQTLLEPDFPEHEVGNVRAEQLGAIAEADNDTRSSADRLMRGAVYPEPNPLGRRILGVADTVQEFGRDEVRAFHTRVYGSGGASIAVVGGFERFGFAVERISSLFGRWPRGSSNANSRADFALHNQIRVDSSVDLPGKSQADLAIGIASIPRNHPDYYAVDIANLILGRLGLMGRLGAEVRDRQGLAYYAFSQIEARRDGSLWSARAGIAAANVEAAESAIFAEIARLREDLVTDEELADAKRYLVGVLPLALESHDGVAATLLAIEEFGLGLDFLDRYPSIIEPISREQVRNAAASHLDPALAAIGIARPAGA
ncbi:MAG: pitrilysin family protein [Thermomicrobiales bacterium]